MVELPSTPANCAVDSAAREALEALIQTTAAGMAEGAAEGVAFGEGDGGGDGDDGSGTAALTLAQPQAAAPGASVTSRSYVAATTGLAQKYALQRPPPTEPATRAGGEVVSPLYARHTAAPAPPPADGAKTDTAPTGNTPVGPAATHASTGAPAVAAKERYDAGCRYALFWVSMGVPTHAAHGNARGGPGSDAL